MTTHTQQSRYPMAEKCLATTHEVQNQPTELVDYNLFSTDTALQESVAREGGSWGLQELNDFGALTGQRDYIELGYLANENKPALHTHDRFGHRIDLVKFHPAYHRLMETSINHGLHSSPWSQPRTGAHVVRTAKCYMQSQIEAAHGCPITMTFAAIPSLRNQPELAAVWEPLITSRHYDPANIPALAKKGVTIGMAMTEKQGGSDVRANSTKAYPIGSPGPGELYELVGHKFFVSAPMCDAFLVLAQTEKGLSCFLLPRWRPDGSKNPLQIQRLKNKMGNVANASSETELRGALAWMVGEEGKGVKTIIEMVSLTRFDCMMGSSAGMRAAINQALHHCQHRSAFGKRLIDQPLMQNVLADLALESEAALTLTMRLANALDNGDQEHDSNLIRIATAIGKYWICKRTPNHAYEAMECIGGSGVMEDSLMPRLFRESPVNAIWEGSGNVQCLDVLRAMYKEPSTLNAYFQEVQRSRGENKYLDTCIDQLYRALQDTSQFEYNARTLVDQMAVALQASLLIQAGNTNIADSYCLARLSQTGAHHYGTLPKGVDCTGIIERAALKR
ncbi:acyl-CoA dehydrogenase-like protein [Oleiphilus messinensis]|uniref:Acyl-CoA dehydrogenase-like protein n=1 Tax=Oleiphilus messinensis TaxID=141451 RepID=A0A1Y0IEI6_9GAMM|nr:acyl-CoA dehydrogenase family protein [Oleiphilus messinensis]ARU58589.1 acyl-CoA dehydrogenase-like protein [Oleiphilus messinensis]